MNNKIRRLHPIDALYILIGVIGIPLLATFHEMRNGNPITFTVAVTVAVYIAIILISSRIRSIEKELEELKKSKQK